jgi:hypothetical protein
MGRPRLTVDSMRSQPNAAVHFSAEFPRAVAASAALYFPSYGLALAKPAWSVAERRRPSVNPRGPPSEGDIGPGTER